MPFGKIIDEHTFRVSDRPSPADDMDISGQMLDGAAGIGEFFRESEDADDVTLLTIYDKDEISNVSDEYIKWLLSEARK